jgi:CubicO group peptidase (beta-lactamase class C family)
VNAEFPRFAPDITIHHLLTHSSGITSYFEEDLNPDYEALWRDTPVYALRGPRDFLRLFTHKPMKFAPGARFEYNDGGYVLLGLVVESVGGRPFTDYVTERIFRAAGMHDSGYFAADALPERTARAYLRNPDGTWRTNVFAVPAVGGPDGGAYTTAPDMTRFWSALREHRLLGADLTARVLSPQIAISAAHPNTFYGFGVWVDAAGDDVRRLYGEGSDPGVAFRSAVYPSHDLVLTAIGNTGDALWPLYRRLEQTLAV